MKLDWLAVVRDVLMILILAFVAAQGTAMALGGLTMTSAVTSSFLAISAGFCVSGCLTPKSRFLHLAVVAGGVWVGSLVNSTTRGLGVEFGWKLFVAAIPLVAVSMLLGGAVSLAIVATPESGAPSEAPPEDSNSSGA